MKFYITKTKNLHVFFQKKLLHYRVSNSRPLKFYITKTKNYAFFQKKLLQYREVSEVGSSQVIVICTSVIHLLQFMISGLCNR